MVGIMRRARRGLKPVVRGRTGITSPDFDHHAAMTAQNPPAPQ